MAVSPGLALDLSRLLSRAFKSKPRGIDRVELLYARWLLARWPGEAVAVISPFSRVRAYSRDRALAGLEALEAIWRERAGAGLAADLRRMGLAPGRAAASAVPEGAIYVNVGNFALAKPKALQWLAQRPDVTRAFMVHDLIPLDHPEFVSAAERRYFNRIADSFRLADGLILNTEAVARHPRLADLPARKIVAALPLAPAFLEPAGQADEARPYVLAYGEIEPRKNFAALTEAWRRLGPDSPAPRLIIACARSPAARALDRALDTWDPPRRRVEIRYNLPTARLRDLVAGACAVFTASFAEGFGLPVAEALALATPVVASDIPAHRSVGGAHARYLPPDDIAAWAAAALALADPKQAAAQRAAASGARRTTPEAYFRYIADALRELALTRVRTRLNSSDI